MIDTLKLRLAEFEVLDTSRLIIQPAPRYAGGGLAGGEPLLWHNPDSSMGPVLGRRAYYNREGRRPYRLTVLPTARHDSHRPNMPRCYVTISVPKFVNGSNLDPVDAATTARAMRHLERRLRHDGVRTDIMKAVVTRLDCFANLATDEPFGCYRPLFKSTRLARTFRQDYDSGSLWGNGEYEVAAYDKRAEMQQRGESTEGRPDHILRFEYRLLNARKVAGVLGVVTVSELLENHERVRRHCLEAIRSKLLPRQTRRLRRTSGSQVEADLLAYKSARPRYWLQDYMFAVGARRIERRIGLGLFKQLLEPHVGHGVAWRFHRKAHEHLRNLMLLRQSKSTGRTFLELYRELRRKLSYLIAEGTSRAVQPIEL